MKTNSPVLLLKFRYGIADGTMGWPAQAPPREVSFYTPYAIHEYVLVGTEQGDTAIYVPRQRPRPNHHGASPPTAKLFHGADDTYNTIAVCPMEIKL